MAAVPHVRRRTSRSHCQLQARTSTSPNSSTLIAPVGTGSELRIDSQTVWVPNRPVREVTPTGRIMEVTGFLDLGSSWNSSGPVTVPLEQPAGGEDQEDLNALPRGPGVFCMEDSLLFEVTIRSKTGSAAVLHSRRLQLREHDRCHRTRKDVAWPVRPQLLTCTRSPSSCLRRRRAHAR